MADDPEDREALEALLDIEDFEHDGRVFVAARIAPHPTAIRSVLEIVDDGDPVPRRAEDLVLGTTDPYFWVRTYAELLRKYVEEVRDRIDLMVGSDLEPDEPGPLGQAFAAESPIGIAARQSVVGIRAHATQLATALFNAAQAQGWPRRRDESVALLELFVDATFAASVLE